ncbi:hypothetical protein acsn021_11260 [Anaerocolumna cellulosilytica]|uniref:Uncharacterized protein n=1 Tax=Anaerocolumna cellulosilytica TaxID=433286 RepID=A0A6S6R0F1_9FIRM|nr:JAB domain-containing protein [Anaerocolumna cellulosilytica]MBB5194613.1 DNA repair protein RadC [Anaerocolumna cellulosilytica]BCJ93557.1 hypothetical protein acsn021_11260 [Anaerocolumna cellulosilytica]
MRKLRTNKETFLEGVHILTGIDLDKMQKYCADNNILHILDHPMEINATEEQIAKIHTLKEIINTYEYFRENDEENKVRFDTPAKLAEFFKSKIAYQKEREYLVTAYFDSKMQVLSTDIAEGSVNHCVINPRELLKRALQLDCAGVAMGHSHPSGDPNPSREDINITKKINIIFNSMKIRFYDHLIIGGNKYFSFTEKGYLEYNDELPKVSDLNPFHLEPEIAEADCEDEMEP